MSEFSESRTQTSWKKSNHFPKAHQLGTKPLAHGHWGTFQIQTITFCPGTQRLTATSQCIQSISKNLLHPNHSSVAQRPSSRHKANSASPCKPQKQDTYSQGRMASPLQKGGRGHRKEGWYQSKTETQQGKLQPCRSTSDG
jgi:hypothetical protein